MDDRRIAAVYSLQGACIVRVAKSHCAAKWLPRFAQSHVIITSDCRRAYFIIIRFANAHSVYIHLFTEAFILIYFVGTPYIYVYM